MPLILKMSKLPNAPLIEVIFELRWKVSTQEDFAKFQYLHGDIFSALKELYPYRESISNPTIPIELLTNKPIYRFRSEIDGYPLIQIGPGIICLNSIDEKYDWQEYFMWASQLINTYFNVNSLTGDEFFTSSLIYIDFFGIYKPNNLLDFINENLNTTFKQRFISGDEKLQSFNLSYSYEKDIGYVVLAINSGTNNGKEGIVTETRINSHPLKADPNMILEWLDSSHSFCSNIFKEMTRGQLYESFK